MGCSFATSRHETGAVAFRLRPEAHAYRPTAQSQFHLEEREVLAEYCYDGSLFSGFISNFSLACFVYTQSAVLAGEDNSGQNPPSPPDGFVGFVGLLFMAELLQVATPPTRGTASPGQGAGI
jgi:hypothetical protein